MVDKHIVPLYRLELVREKDLSYGSVIKIEAAAEVFHAMLDSSHVEKLAMIHLNSGGEMIGAELIAMGSLEQVGTTMAEMFKGALLNNAASVWVAHNHVDGNVTPSDPDIRFTERVQAASKLLDIRLEDHLVIAPGKHYSIRSNMRTLQNRMFSESKDRIMKLLLGGLAPLPLPRDPLPALPPYPPKKSW